MSSDVPNVYEESKGGSNDVTAPAEDSNLQEDNSDFSLSQENAALPSEWKI